jgi:hypothetical protein
VPTGSSSTSTWAADDGVIVHHDYRLGRTTEVAEVAGRHLVSQLATAELTSVPLIGEVSATLPTLADVIEGVHPPPWATVRFGWS